MDAHEELQKALELLGLFEIYDSVPDDHGYVGSGLERRVTEFRVRHGHPSINNPGRAIDQPLRDTLREAVEPALGLSTRPVVAGTEGRMDRRLSVFTHWVVSTEPHIREMAGWLWTNSQIFAVVPAEGAEGLVLCTDQAGWDVLREGFDRRPDVDLRGG